MKNTSSSNSFLITGATGFIGSALFRHLVDEGAPVWRMTRSSNHACSFPKARSIPSPVVVDLATVSQEQLRRLLPEVDVVFHMAAGGVTDLSPDLNNLKAVNVSGTEKMLLAARDSGVRRFVYLGSCFEYGEGSNLSEDQELHPISHYAKTKAEASQAVVEASPFFEQGSVVLRPFMVYGPGEAPSRLVPYLIQNALTGQQIDLTGGEQTRDLVFISDVVQALLKASSMRNIQGEVFNICSGHGVSIRTVADMVLQLTQSESKLKLGVLPYREHEAMSVVGSPEKSLKAMGWSAKTSLKEGLTQTIASVKRESMADE